jgi:ABC transporter substrate binding protein
MFLPGSIPMVTTAASNLRGMAWLLLLTAPQACSLVGRQHGRSIPFSDIGPVQLSKPIVFRFSYAAWSQSAMFRYYTGVVLTRANMRRPEFIKIIIGSALAWPLAAQAEQPGPGKWRIGMLAPEIRQKPTREGLRELGYVEGQNLLIEWRFDDRADRFAALAIELVGLKPDVIAAIGTQAVRAAQQATKRIPIVMVASNPIGNGLVESLTRLSLLTPERRPRRHKNRSLAAPWPLRLGR